MFYDIPAKIMGAGVLVIVTAILAGIIYVGLMIAHVLPLTLPPVWLALWAFSGLGVALCGVISAMIKDIING